MLVVSDDSGQSLREDMRTNDFMEGSEWSADSRVEVTRRGPATWLIDMRDWVLYGEGGT